MKNAFIAWTPLHIINIMNTVQAFYEDQWNDLYVYDEFAGAHDIYKNLKKQTFFKHVYLVPYKETGNTLEKGLSMIINRQNMINHETVYDNIFIQGGNYFSKILYGEVKKKNPSLRLHYIEDGIGAYIDSSVILLDTLPKKAVKMLNRYSMYHAEVENYYVYEPNLIKTKNNENYLQLPKLTADNPVLPAVRRAFALENEEGAALKKQILYFDQPFLADGASINEMELVEVLRSMDSDMEMVIKFHPRSPKDKYGAVHALETSLPWELFLLTHEMEDVVLLSVTTTSSFTPYLMFDRKMPVIMLADYYLKKVKKEQGNQPTITMLENVVNFSHAFKEQTGAEIHMPESLDELQTLLKVGEKVRKNHVFN